MLSFNAKALVSVREGVLGAGACLNLSSVPRVTRAQRPLRSQTDVIPQSF